MSSWSGFASTLCAGGPTGRPPLGGSQTTRSLGAVGGERDDGELRQGGGHLALSSVGVPSGGTIAPSGSAYTITRQHARS
jgi:hypothetical protein